MLRVILGINMGWMKIFFILPIFLSLHSLSFSQSNLRFENGILRNDFLELTLEDSWVLNSVNDGSLNLITANLSQGISTDILLSAEYSASIFNFLDQELNNDLNYAVALNAKVIKSQFFISAVGGQACGVHYELEKRGITEIYYSFHFDGTTTGYSGNEEEWLRVSILFTEYGLSTSPLSFEDAKDVADKILFTEGQISPNKILPQLKDLEVGDVLQSDINNTENEEDYKISLTRDIKNGPISFSVTEDTNVNLIESYFEFTSGTIGQFSLISDSAQEISPDLAVGLDAESKYNITADASYPATSMHIFSDFENENLDSWASKKQSTWKNSPNGMIFSSDYFTTKSGYKGISIVRETGITRDYYIGVDLSNAAWENRNKNIAQSSFLRLQISGFDDPIKNGYYPTILEIAKTLDFNQTTVPSLSEVIELNSDYGSDESINLDRDVLDGPISFSIPDTFQIDWKEGYIERALISKAQYNLNDPSNLLSANLLVFTEDKFKSLNEWGEYQQLTWQNSEKGKLLSVHEFTNDNGFEGMAIIREQGSINDFVIVLDLTTSEWKERYSNHNEQIDDAWLRFQINGFQDPSSEGIYPTALTIANSIDFDTNFIPNIGNTLSESTSDIVFDTLELNSTVTDGPIEYLVKENTLVDYFDNYNENGLSTVAKYNITPGNTDSFKTISLKTEEFYRDLDEWAYYQKYAWENSDNGVLKAAKFFKTDNNASGVYIVRETNSTRDFRIAIDLTNQSWLDRYNSNVGAKNSAWLKAEFISSNNPIYNPIFAESIATAKSLHFIKSKNIVSPIFREISPTTLFNASKLGSSWFISDWFGVFYETNSSWIYHELLGWMYALEITPTSGWFWHEGFDWIWASKETYPYFYHNDSSTWLFFNDLFLKEKKYYDFAQKKWLILDLLKKILTDNAGNEEETIKRIMRSSLLEEEKLNGIGQVILYGNN